MPILQKFQPVKGNKHIAGVILSRDLRSKKNPYWVQWKLKDNIRKNAPFTSKEEAEKYFNRMVDKVKASMIAY